jgi:M6 family metalloprotease-like protein
MTKPFIRRRPIAAGLTVLFFAWSVGAQPDKKVESPDLAEYKTVETAITARIDRTGMPVAPRPGFLGLSLSSSEKGTVVGDVATDSPAAKAGVQAGDVLLKFDGKAVASEGDYRDLLRSKLAGEAVKLSLSRKDRPLDITATLDAVSKPMPAARQRERASLGMRVTAANDGKGVIIDQIYPGSAAEKARLKTGETVLQIDGTALSDGGKLREVLADKKPDDTVTLTLLLAEKNVEYKVKLGAESVVAGGSFDTRGNFGYWTKPTYRLGIILVDYPDVKHNEKIAPKAWEESMFAHGTYTKTSATGGTVHGSMYDYYLEQSYGALKIEGKAFEHIEVSKKRSEYATGNRTALLSEAMDKITARDGKDAFKDLDGVFFIYAGESYRPAIRGSLYWPHRSSVRHNGKSWPYFICPEGGSRMTNISVFCHEFGHMLGLPDLYARPENPGMEGVGVWCAMANQVGTGKPQHFCAWSKDRLGWIKPTVIDPTVKQKLILAPIEDSPKECVKVLARPDGSEYFLIENRKKKGFDASLPAEGLLIWRVVGNRPILEESHGVEGSRGPYVFLSSVPYPSASNDAFTPFTTPSSRSQLGGGLPVYLTNIRRLPDGRITFHIGYEYQ